jgi:protein-S-isoprenylcysteine O-methyltransferase Ste14
MKPIIIFLILSIPIIALSWRSLVSIKNHGFYRFWGWECIIWLLVSNFQYWFYKPFSLLQILSWILLFIGSYYIIASLITFRKYGNSHTSRNDPSLFGFEKTTKLVNVGIYKYIRHPMYSSLIFVTWGICLKNISIEQLTISIIASILFFITAKRDEKECIEYFGKSYIEYMKQSKMFIPFIL